MQVIKATAPETQKVHIKHAQIEIDDGTMNYKNAVLTCITTPNFQWSEQEKKEHRAYIGRAIRRLEGLYNYFNLPE